MSCTGLRKDQRKFLWFWTLSLALWDTALQLDDSLLWSLSPIKFSANILEFENGPRIYKTLGITVLAHFLYSFTMTFFQENLLFLWASHHESTSQLGWHILRGKREYCLRVWIFKSNSCVTFSGELTSLYLSFLIFRRRIIPVPSPRIAVKVKWVNLSPSANNSSQPIKVPSKGQKVSIFPLPLELPFSAFSSFTKAAHYTQLLMPETWQSSLTLPFPSALTFCPSARLMAYCQTGFHIWELLPLLPSHHHWYALKKWHALAIYYTIQHSEQYF